MSNPIKFLELMGQDAELRGADADAVERAAVDAGLPADVRAALLRNDHATLAALVQAGPVICCGMARTPDEDEEEEDEPGKEDEVRAERAA